MEREDKAEATLSGPSQHTLRRRASISSNERKDDAPETSVVAGPKVLAFEFRALESCLESACGCLDSEVCVQFLLDKCYCIITYATRFLLQIL